LAEAFNAAEEYESASFFESKELDLLPRTVPNPSLVASERDGLVENTANSPNSFTSGIDDDFNEAVELTLGELSVVGS